MKTSITPVLKDKIAEILKREIYLNNIKDGEELTQELISEKLGVSRMPVREAFLQLEAEGVLKRLKNRHVIVIGMNAKRIKQLFNVLEAMEIAIISSIENTEAIERSFKKYKMSVPLQGEEINIRLMLDFRLSFSEAIDNPYLYQLHEKCLMGFSQFLYREKFKNWKWDLEQNEIILNAILKKEDEMISKCIQKYYSEIATIALKAQSS